MKFGWTGGSGVIVRKHLKGEWICSRKNLQTIRVLSVLSSRGAMKLPGKVLRVNAAGKLKNQTDGELEKFSSIKNMLSYTCFGAI